MNAIKHLIDDKDPLIMYHRQEDEIKIPIAFKLTEEGKRIALLLHEQKQGPIKFTIRYQSFQIHSFILQELNSIYILKVNHQRIEKFKLN